MVNLKQKIDEYHLHKDKPEKRQFEIFSLGYSNTFLDTHCLAKMDPGREQDVYNAYPHFWNIFVSKSLKFCFTD